MVLNLNDAYKLEVCQRVLDWSADSANLNDAYKLEVRQRVLDWSADGAGTRAIPRQEKLAKCTRPSGANSVLVTAILKKRKMDKKRKRRIFRNT
jgi:hypothetical protein